jgi:hypothetical protein
VEKELAERVAAEADLPPMGLEAAAAAALIHME